MSRIIFDTSTLSVTTQVVPLRQSAKGLWRIHSLPLNREPELQFNTLSGLNYYKFITNVFFWSKYTQRGHMAQGHTGLTGLSIYHQQIP